MKRLAGCLLSVCCCILLCTHAHALTYVDDFNDGANNNIKTYTNLAGFSMDSVYWNGLPDKSAFSFASSSSPIGSAVYQVQNARQISVGIYTLTGSFVGRKPEGLYILGAAKNADGTDLSVSQLTQARYSPTYGSAYATVADMPCKVFIMDTDYVFLPTQETPGDLIGYGVNVYTSVTGQSWSPVALAYSAVYNQSRNAFCYEELSGSIPAGARYVKVELNDFKQLQTWEGNTVLKAETAFNCLASVMISGENLTVGTPEPQQSEPEPVSSQNTAVLEYHFYYRADSGGSDSTRASSGSASGGASTGKASGSSQAPSSSSSTSSRYEGQKFEGVIELPSSGSRGGSADQSGSRPQTETASSAPLEPAPLRESDEIAFEIAPSGTDRKFDGAITIYIIVVTGALAFTVLAAIGKK